jgi:hypothetical protein
MSQGSRGPRVAVALLAATLGSAALAACGSSGSGNAASLLKQTFSGTHTVTSGNLSFSLTLTPSGSSSLKGPITVSFGGPFQSRGKGALPESNFNVSYSALGRSGSLGILSTGTAGYVTLSGASYQLPTATFQRLESSFSSVASSAGGGSRSGTLGKLGINPLAWLVNPSVVGTDSVAGTTTTHIHAGVNVASLLGDLSTFLQKASTSGVSGASHIPTSIPAATRNRIAAEVKNPSFDVWTGKGDKTLRKLSINVIVPVSGQLSTLLGGLRSTAIGINMQYANLNQPQSIAAPTNIRPFSQFAAKLRTFSQAIQGAVGSGALSGAGAATGSGASSGSSSAANAQSYGQCLQAAGTDVAKMQRCAALLNQ